MSVAGALPTTVAAATTLSDLVPYMILLGAGFLVGAWGQAAKVPLVVAIGILMVILAVVLFQLQTNDFPGLPSGL